MHYINLQTKIHKDPNKNWIIKKFASIGAISCPLVTLLLPRFAVDAILAVEWWYSYAKWIRNPYLISPM